MIKKLFLLLPLVVLLGCQANSDRVESFSGTAMTIPYNIKVGRGLSRIDRKNVEGIISSTFDEINRIHNKWNPQSELSKLNSLPAGEKKILSNELKRLFVLADKVVVIGGGRFDPTIEPVQKLWRKYLEAGATPSEKEIFELKRVVGWSKIHFSEGVFWKDEEGMLIDFGAIAKGYCVDLIVERLNAENFADVYVEWGGEIRATGKHPENRPWNIFICKPNDTNPDNALAFVSLADQSIATSGDYLQSWTVFSGKDRRATTYHHIIDPLTCTALTQKKHAICSASVLASTCAFADGLATVALLFNDLDEARKWAEEVQQEYPEVVFWFYERE